jgi:predicted transcriptional regulator of viral defense system
MDHRSATATLSKLSARSLGVFRGRDAIELGVSRKQISALHVSGVVERVLADTYRMTAVAASSEQRLRAALLWAGHRSAAAGRSAGELYGLEGVCARIPEIVLPRSRRKRTASVLVHRCDHWPALMVREWRGLRVTGVESTLATLALVLDDEALEIACEDARRRRLTSVPALRAYLARFDSPVRPGAARIRRLVHALDPVYPSRSTLEVKTRRLLVANGFTDFVREVPLDWNGRTYRFDFSFEHARTILETNGRRWHDDPADYEGDNEKWSVPARHGYRIVFATWEKVTRSPADLLSELAAALAA